jgi:hypothetical protein
MRSWLCVVGVGCVGTLSFSKSTKYKDAWYYHGIFCGAIGDSLGVIIHFKTQKVFVEVFQ